MKDNDGMLALLQDIKELLWGIALLMIGGFLCLIGVIIGNWGLVLLVFGLFTAFCGGAFAWHGFSRREIAETQD